MEVVWPSELWSKGGQDDKFMEEGAVRLINGEASVRCHGREEKESVLKPGDHMAKNRGLIYSFNCRDTMNYHLTIWGYTCNRPAPEPTWAWDGYHSRTGGTGMQQGCSSPVQQDPNSKKMRNRVKQMERVDSIYQSMNLGTKRCVRVNARVESFGKINQMIRYVLCLAVRNIT